MTTAADRPELIGRYRIVRELGRGGFATVYLAEDRGLDDLVAIKILSDLHAADPDAVGRFVAEARVMRNLRAPGVVAVHDVGEHEGRPFFVMEYCERGTLAERLEAIGRPLTVDEGVGLATALARAMGAMHEATPPVVHRDIKPGNLLLRHRPRADGRAVGGLLGPDEELIVGDFGLAKVVDVRATKLSLIAYTRGFASPEQVRGDGTVQPNADVYSASAVLVAALSAERPEQVFADQDRPFSDLAMAATGPLREELTRGLSFDRARRHPTVVEWADALTTADALATAPPPAPSPAQSAPAAPPTVEVAAPPSVPNDGPGVVPPTGPPVGARRTRRGIVVAVAALVGALVLAAGALALRSPEETAIVGPDRGLVGDELAFAAVAVEVEAWELQGRRTTDPVLRLMPAGAGEVAITAVLDGSEQTITVEIVEPTSSLRIAGPGLLPIDEVTELTAVGVDTTDVVWTVDGQQLRQPTLQVRPRAAGIFRVELGDGGGATVARTFTVARP